MATAVLPGETVREPREGDVADDSTGEATEGGGRGEVPAGAGDRGRVDGGDRFLWVVVVVGGVCAVRHRVLATDLTGPEGVGNAGDWSEGRGR